MKEIAWLVYAAGFVLHWYKRWLVVREYTRRPRRYLAPGPTGFLIFAGWITLAMSYVLLFSVYSLLLAGIVAAVTGVVLYLVTRVYFNREVAFWTDYYLDLAQRFERGESVAGKERTPVPEFMQTSDEEKLDFAKKSAVEFVESIRRSPIGLGSIED